METEPTVDVEAAASITTSAPDPVEGHSDAALVEDELLVEEISIDGMCGVY